ncbi:hypothetical protein ACM7LV_26745 [Pseudomonas aeruginosa]|uniref:Uncharacterized protein n=1 Tax=Pseudomonas aeruginosa TaxID=287 RepID=A0A9P1VYW7_PSEAI|nr:MULTISPECIES: hypothetical protein [Pseudomonas]KFF32426.1 hypothetical protein G039_0333010 [Pseudomonas aeruginosa VRFPA01]SCZ07493.1 Uncharacterised protein [Acinetobacter baumannii]EKV3606943.1 hypothetical protein [Pseudomonas aeruginosa]EKW6796128.1 hypothetical protein [Pseudomonas aeruginosa]EKX7258189.1 hypothetical protein [Pseudomonas aeruginosa]
MTQSLRADYWTGSIGIDPETNAAFLHEVRQFLEALGLAFVTKQLAKSFDVKEQLPARAGGGAGHVVLYLVSTKDGIGATLIVAHRPAQNPFVEARPDGLQVHAQKREINPDGLWKSETLWNNAITIPSTDRVVIEAVLTDILVG